MDTRRSRTSSSPLYIAEGRKLKSFFIRYWLHPHIKAATVITESASFSVRNPIWGGFTKHWLLSIHKELILKLRSQLPCIHFFCISPIDKSHYLGLWPSAFYKGDNWDNSLLSSQNTYFFQIWELRRSSSYSASIQTYFPSESLFSVGLWRKSGKSILKGMQVLWYGAAKRETEGKIQWGIQFCLVRLWAAEQSLGRAGREETEPAMQDPKWSRPVTKSREVSISWKEEADSSTGPSSKGVVIKGLGLEDP